MAVSVHGEPQRGFGFFERFCATNRIASPDWCNTSSCPSHNKGMNYLCETSSLEGFVQQIACNYLPHGYWFYVTGRVPDGKPARLVDEKLVAKYGIDVSRATRSRRKLAGNANLHYIRHERLFVLLATRGKHSFFDEEQACLRDVRENPIQYGGYSMSYRRGGMTRDGKPDPKWHSHVEIARKPYNELTAYYLDMARHRSGDWLAQELYQFPFEPYAPIRRQMLKILRKANRVRKRAGYTILPPDVLPMRRRVVKPFGQRLPSPENVARQRA